MFFAFGFLLYAFCFVLSAFCSLLVAFRCLLFCFLFALSALCALFFASCFFLAMANLLLSALRFVALNLVLLVDYSLLTTAGCFWPLCCLLLGHRAGTAQKVDCVSVIRRLASSRQHATGTAGHGDSSNGADMLLGISLLGWRLMKP